MKSIHRIKLGALAVKRLTLLAAVLISLHSAACGGSGTGIQPPPPKGNFTNASLKGNYVFSMTGEDLSFNPIMRIGSFIADGNGNITNAIEDKDDGGGSIGPAGLGTAISFGTGNYSIQPNGQGTLTLGSLAGTGLQFSIALNGPAPKNSGLMIQTDLNASSSGTFAQQDTSIFTTPFAVANYVFDFSGSDNVGGPLSLVGVIAANAGTTLGAGTLDSNNATGPSGPQAISNGTYTPDNTSGNAQNFGRFLVSFGGLQFAMYPIDQTHAKFLEIDGTQAFTSGDAFEQTGTIPTQASGFTNSFVYLVGGSATVINQGAPITRAARFTADGTGNLGTIREDHNLDGNFACLDPNDPACTSGTPAGSYTITPAVNGNFSPGRGTLSIPLGASMVTSVFYLASPNTAVIQDTSINEVADGTMLAQAGSLGTSGNFVFNLSGQTLQSSGNLGFEEDFVGQYALSSAATNNISGTSDFTELGSLSKHSEPFVDIATTGTLTVKGDGTQRNTYSIIFSPSDAPAATLNFTGYIGGSPPQLLLIGTDKQSRVTVGAVLTQTSPQ